MVGDGREGDALRIGILTVTKFKEFFIINFALKIFHYFVSTQYIGKLLLMG
jgi:hypothetical protein